MAILCASRSDEVLKATWTEFKREERGWVIPAARMKAGKERRLPLSDAAMGILEKQKAIRSNDYVFAGRGSGPAGKDTPGAMRKRPGHHLVLPLAGTELHHLDRVPLGRSAPTPPQGAG